MTGLLLGIAFVLVWKGGQVFVRVVAVQYAAAGRVLTRFVRWMNQPSQAGEVKTVALPEPKVRVMPPKGGTGESKPTAQELYAEFLQHVHERLAAINRRTGITAREAVERMRELAEISAREDEEPPRSKSRTSSQRSTATSYSKPRATTAATTLTCGCGACIRSVVSTRPRFRGKAGAGS